MFHASRRRGPRAPLGERDRSRHGRRALVVVGGKPDDGPGGGGDRQAHRGRRLQLRVCQKVALLPVPTEGEGRNPNGDNPALLRSRAQIAGGGGAATFTAAAAAEPRRRGSPQSGRALVHVHDAGVFLA